MSTKNTGTHRTVADSIRSLELMADNARLPKYIKTELIRIAWELHDMQERECALSTQETVL